MQKLKSYAQIASDKLQGKNVTCAGCVYRVLLMQEAEWTENCVKETHPPQSHNDFESLSATSPVFKHICPLFKGRSVAVDRGDDYRIYRPSNKQGQIYALDVREAYTDAVLPFAASRNMKGLKGIKDGEY
jgi:hypothetical protein